MDVVVASGQGSRVRQHHERGDKLMDIVAVPGAGLPPCGSIMKEETI
jgi:hypothetical protein